jgi:hypothetical protein
VKQVDTNRMLDVFRRPQAVPSDIEGKLQLFEDHRRITELIMAYGWLCDAREWDELLELYTDDFERTLSGLLDEHLVGKDALREAYFRPVLPRKDSDGGPPPAEQLNTYEINHLIHPPIVRIDGDSAHATTVAHMAATSDNGVDIKRGTHEAAYIFEFRREADKGWRFSRMEVISENPRNPLFR